MMSCMYRCCPHCSRGQIDKSRVEAISPGGAEAPHSPLAPVVTHHSLKGARKWAEAPGVLNTQEIPHAGQCHHQDKSWDLEEERKTFFFIISGKTQKANSLLKHCRTVTGMLLTGGLAETMCLPLARKCWREFWWRVQRRWPLSCSLSAKSNTSWRGEGAQLHAGSEYTADTKNDRYPCAPWDCTVINASRTSSSISFYLSLVPR